MDPIVKPWRSVRREVDLPGATAVWVLTAHVLTIASPALLVAAVSAHRAYLETVLDRPDLLIWSALAFVVASVCESAQNTLDRWYLTGTPPSLLDWLFNTLVVAGLGLQVLAVAGDREWVWGVVILGVLVFADFYLIGLPTAPVQAIMGLASAVLLFRALDQPVVFASLVSVFFTLFFLDVLVRTRQQVMHGFTTIVNVTGVVATALAIGWAATGQAGVGWLGLIVVSVALVGLALVLRPRLLRLPATPRAEQAEEAASTR